MNALASTGLTAGPIVVIALVVLFVGAAAFIAARAILKKRKDDTLS